MHLDTFHRGTPTTLRDGTIFGVVPLQEHKEAFFAHPNVQGPAELPG